MTDHPTSSDPHPHRPPHRGPIQPWPESGYDAALHLLDRQIVDVDGRAVGKVDDIELTEQAGALVPTGLLVGLGALLPRCGMRLGPWLARRYGQMSISHATRRAPAAVDLALVEDVTSAVHLSVPRAGLLHPRIAGPTDPVRRRLGDLVGMPVIGGAGSGVHPRSRVLDVHLAANPDQPGSHAVTSLLVGPGRPGALLGYDRRRSAHPWPVAAIVRRLHRHSGTVDWDERIDVDWEQGRVRIGDTPLRPLRAG